MIKSQKKSYVLTEGGGLTVTVRSAIFNHEIYCYFQIIILVQVDANSNAVAESTYGMLVMNIVKTNLDFKLSRICVGMEYQIRIEFFTIIFCFSILPHQTLSSG